MKKRFVLPALILAVALVASGCLQVKGWRYSQKSVAEGDKVSLNIRMAPVFPDESIDSTPFVLLGYNSMDPGSYSWFDLGGFYGGPYNAQNDLALRTVAKQDCTSFGVAAEDFSVDSWRAYHAGTTVDVTGNDPLWFKHRAGPPLGTTALAGSVLVFSGVWSDDGNGVAEPGEIICSGMVSTSVDIK